MDSSNGHSVTRPSKAGSGPTSAESVRDDALLQDTLDEIAELFRIKEAFPFAEEKQDAEQEEGEVERPGWWRRVADWCFGRSARTRTRPATDGDRQPDGTTQGSA